MKTRNAIALALATITFLSIIPSLVTTPGTVPGNNDTFDPGSGVVGSIRRWSVTIASYRVVA